MIRQLAICFAIAGLAASCGPDKPATEKSPGTLNVQSATKTQSDMPIPPADAQFTIYCQVFNGGDHYERARAIRQALRDSSPMKDWYLIHAGEKSTLYYGFYRSVNPRDTQDGKEGARAIEDLNNIRAMRDVNGDHPFSASLPVLIDSPDPSTNQAWDLTRTNGYYSLEIAAYRDSPNRKAAAVEAVAEARKNGIEAYYFHGPTMSSVCIGCWPKEAALEIDPGAANSDPDAVNKDPNAPLVVTARPLAPNAAAQFAQRGIQTISPGIRPIDPTMTDMMRRYPEHAVNGEVIGHHATDPVTGADKIEPSHSFLVKVPHRDDADDFAAGPADGGAPGAAMRNQSPEDRGTMGRLRGIGD